MQKKNLIVYHVLLVVILCGIFAYSKKTSSVPTQQPEPPKQTTSDNSNVTDSNSDAQQPNTDTVDSLKDGKYFIVLEKINADSGSITFDQAEIFFSGQNDEEIKKLGENPDDLPSGYLIHNKDETLSTLSLDKNININLVDVDSENPATTFKTISLEEFLKLVGNEQQYSYFYITVQNNMITDMYEQYVP